MSTVTSGMEKVFYSSSLVHVVPFDRRGGLLAIS